MRRSLALLCAILAAPAVAQTTADQFAAAARTFTLPGTPSLALGDLIEDDAVMALLPGLEGTWIWANALSVDLTAFDSELLARSCERTGMALEQTAERSFVITRQVERDGEVHALRIRHDWMIGNSFDRGVEESEVIAYMNLEAMGDITSTMLALPNLRGEVSLFHPSPDILVFSAPLMPLEILARCP